MSIWVSVYCRTKVGSIRPAKFVAAIRERVNRFEYLFAQEDPDDALARLRVETCKLPSSPAVIHLHYLGDDLPVVIDRVTRAKVVKGYVEEYLEERFVGRTGKRAAEVREHLNNTVEIVNFCLKQRHADGMGCPIVYAAAAWLAEVGDGLARIDEQGWMRVNKKGGFTVLVGE